MSLLQINFKIKFLVIFGKFRKTIQQNLKNFELILTKFHRNVRFKRKTNFDDIHLQNFKKIGKF